MDTKDLQQLVQGIIQVAQHRPDPLLEVCGQGGLGSGLVANAAVVRLMALVAKHVLCLLPSLADPLVGAGGAPLGRPAAGVQERRLGRGGPWPRI